MITEGSGNQPNEPKVEFSLDTFIGNGSVAPTATPAPNGTEGSDDGNKGVQPPVDTTQQLPATITPSNEPAPPSDEGETYEQLISKFTSTDITPEDKEDRDILLSTFKAANIDAKGNLLNDKGEVILSTEKVKNYLESQELPLDQAGNLVNDKGEIIKTKADIDTENSIVLSTKNRIENNFGIAYPSNLTLEDNEEGIFTLLEEGIKIANQGSIKKFLDSVPSVKAFYEHTLLGGTPETFINTAVDYKGIKIKEIAEDAKFRLLREAFTKQGTPNVDNLISIIKKGGEEDINKATADAILYLDKSQEDANKSREESLKQAIEEENQVIEKYWNDVENVLKVGKLKNISIPAVDKEGFHDYLSKPVDDKNRSKHMIDAEKESLEDELLIAYLRFKGGDLGKLVNNMVSEKRVSTLREAFNKNKRSNAISSVPHKAEQSLDGNLSLETLLSQRKTN